MTALTSSLPRPLLGSPVATMLSPAGWLEAAGAWVGGTLDAAVLAAMWIAVDRLVAPSPEDVGRILDSAAPFLAPALQAEPSRFLDAVRRSRPPRSSESYVGPLGDGIRMTRHIEWDSADPMHVEHWLHAPGASRGTVVAVHGFAMGYSWLDARALFAHDWFAHGLDVALYSLPRHGPRSPKEARFSGDGFATSDVGDMNRVLRQAVHELGTLVGMLRSETGAPVGVLGLSIGGTLAALLASRDAELDFVVPMAPPACLGDLGWRVWEGGRPAAGVSSGAAPDAAGTASGSASSSSRPTALGRDELRACFRVHSPLAHPLRVPRERVLIVAGRGDRIVPPEHPLALWQHWGEPAIHWYAGSHLAPFGRRGVAEAIAGHLRGLGIL